MTEPLVQQAGLGGSPDRARTAPRLLGPAVLVSVAYLATNALAYAFTVLAARVLAPAAFRELAALLAVLLAGAVPATGLQTAAALYLGRDRDGDRARALARLHGTAVVAGLVVVAGGVLAAAPVTALLHLPDATAVGWLVAMLLPTTVV